MNFPPSVRSNRIFDSENTIATSYPLTIDTHSTIDGVVQPNSNSLQSWSGIAPNLVCRSQLTDEERRHIELLAFQYGSTPETYDVAISNGSVLRTPCGNGAISVLPDRRYWHIPGGLMCRDELKPAFVNWLNEISSSHNKTVALYSVSSEDEPLFRDAGFQVNKFSEEPVIDLGEIDWKGKPFIWVRRQVNFCRRAGIEIIEVSDPQQQAAISADLVEILKDDLSERTYCRPLKLLEGEFDPNAQLRRRLFIARNTETNQIEAFLSCSPMLNGTSWAFETYRKRKSATRGVTAFLFYEVINRFQREGVQNISLCQVPGRGVENESAEHGDSRVRWLLIQWYKRLNFLFNTKGQDYFKSRFRPRYIDRYVCVTPKNTNASIVSFLKTAGALTPNPVNLTRNLFKR